MYHYRWDNSINTCNFAKSGNCGSSDRNLDYPVVTEKTTRRPGTTIEGPRTPTRGWKPDRTSTSDNRETISSSGTGASEFTTQKTSEKGEANVSSSKFTKEILFFHPFLLDSYPNDDKELDALEMILEKRCGKHPGQIVDEN